MKTIGILIVGLSLCSARLFATGGSASVEPVVIEGLGVKVHRMVAMMKHLNMTNQQAAEKLSAVIFEDGQIDETERRLIDALSAEKFSIIVRPAAGTKNAPREVVSRGALELIAAVDAIAPKP